MNKLLLLLLSILILPVLADNDTPAVVSYINEDVESISNEVNNLEVQTTSISNSLSESYSIATNIIHQEEDRNIVLVTGESNFNNIQGRNNITFCIPKYNYDSDTGVVTANIFTNKKLLYSPELKARIKYNYGESTYYAPIECDWTTPVDTYETTKWYTTTNFVVTGMVTNETTIVTTNEVDFTYTAYEAEVTTNAVTYTAVEYLQSSGTQYIKTGVVPTLGLQFLMHCYYPTPTTTASGQCAMGMRNTSTIWRYMVSNYVSDGSHGYASFWANSRGISTYSGVYDYTFALTNNVFTRDGKYVYTPTQSTCQLDLTQTNRWELYLFAGNYYSEYPSTLAADYASCSIYYCDYWDKDNAPLRKFRPALHPTTGEACMIDLLTAKYYTNAGTGAFSYGGTPTETTIEGLYTYTTNYYPVTRTETRELVLTNSVITVVDGTRPTIVLAGDTETFEAYMCTFTIPEDIRNLGVSIDFKSWGIVADDNTEYNIGSRYLAVNGRVTADCNSSTLGKFFGNVKDKDGNPVSGTFYLKYGLIRKQD